ncbi:MAG: ybgC [Micavibrio sp.]|nr:ybgC [Micavibrio sp.]
MPAHQITPRVYYEDTDAGGIVYHANYLKFAERGRTELLRAAGYDHLTLLEKEGLLFIVRKMEIDYQAPARLDDILTVKTSIKELKNASFIMNQSIFCHEVLVCSMVVTLVCVTKDIKPIRMPDSMRASFNDFTE